MLEILRKFFRFCDERERSEFYRSIVLGVLAALFSALKIPAIGVMLQAILTGGVTAKTILLSLAIMLISVIGSSILKYRATALQTDGGLFHHGEQARADCRASALSAHGLF